MKPKCFNIFYNYKYKKLKGSVAFLVFILSVSMLILCSFGVDACYIILSRHKLQKITEQVAIEYAGSLNTDLPILTSINKNDRDNEVENRCEEINNRYKNIFKVIGAGTPAFKITNMSYKANRDTGTIAAKVSSESKVMPQFLKFIGIKEIIIHANAFAFSKKITISKSTTNPIDTNFATYAFDNIVERDKAVMIEFGPDFVDDTDTNNAVKYITAKNLAQNDILIEVNYKQPQDGYFVLGGYDYIDPLTGTATTGWIDLGKVVNTSNPATRIRKQAYKITAESRAFPHSQDGAHSEDPKISFYKIYMYNYNHTLPTYHTSYSYDLNADGFFRFNLQGDGNGVNSEISTGSTATTPPVGYAGKLNRVRIYRIPSITYVVSPAPASPTYPDANPFAGHDIIYTYPTKNFFAHVYASYSYCSGANAKVFLSSTYCRDGSGSTTYSRPLQDSGTFTAELTILNNVFPTTAAEYNSFTGVPSGADDTISGNCHLI